jgi:hypothetical protein
MPFIARFCAHAANAERRRRGAGVSALGRAGAL